MKPQKTVAHIGSVRMVIPEESVVGMVTVTSEEKSASWTVTTHVEKPVRWKCLRIFIRITMVNDSEFNELIKQPRFE